MRRTSSPAASKESPSEAPAVLNRFDPKGVLGVGPLGKIYTAVEKETGRTVAFRGFVRPPDAEPDHWQAAIDRYTRELTAAQALDHPNIAHLYDFGEENGFYYIVSEWYDGEALQMKLDRGERFGAEEMLQMLGQAGRAIEFAASKKIYHGDITPFNLVVTTKKTVHVVNYGLANCRPKEDSVYLAPEQLRGADGDERSDLFCLGLIMYQLLSGHHPFAASLPAETQQKILTEPTPKLPNVEPYLQQIVIRLLAKDPRQRYQAWAEVAADIVRHTATAPPPLRESAPVDAELSPSKARPSLADYSLSANDVAIMKSRLESQQREAGEAKRKVLFRALRWGFAAVFTLAIAHTLFRGSSEHVVTLRQVKGDVKIGSAADRKNWRTARAGDRLRAHDVIRTGAGAEAVVAIGDGSRLFLRPNSYLGIQEVRSRSKGPRRARIFFLGHGSVLSKVRPRPGQEFAVVTRLGRATAKGTEFSVSLSSAGELQVATFSGKVEAANDEGKTQVVTGEKLVLAEGEKPEKPSSLSAEEQDALKKALQQLGDTGALAQVERLLASLEDSTLVPVTDGAAGIGEAIGGLLNFKSLKAGSARAKAMEAMQGLVYALEMGDEHGAYPSSLDVKTLEELGVSDETRESILGQFKDHRLEYYKRLPNGYEFAARCSDEKGTLLVAKNGKITTKTE
jgi:hypothetical protein